jgi:hypothetical protein
VAPPSIHPISGQPYRWIGDPNEYSHDAIPVFDPAWIDHPARSCESKMNGQGEIRNVRAYIRKIVAVSGQGGHNATFRVACKLRDAGLSELDALAEMILWQESGCAQPPWQLKDLVHKVRDAYRRTKHV